MKKLLLLSIALSVLVLWAIGCGGGGSSSGGGGNAGGGNPNPVGSSGGGSGGVGATINLSANGLDNTQPSVGLGERLRVTNNDTRTHQFMTTPHNVHTDCPALNAIGSLAPGQSGTSDPLTSARGCGFHDHMNPDDPKFRGQVLVGLASGDPPPPDPSYVR